MRFGFALALLGANAFAAAPTFDQDIAPILYQNCAGCHRPGQVAPFSLLTYQDAAKRADLIATVTTSRYMPPWKAEPCYGHFQDERRLTDAQLALIRDWVNNGAPEGNPKVVHHALFFLDLSGEARRLNAAANGNGYSCFGGPRIVPSAGLGGWAPGATPQPLPAGMGYAIEKGADLVMQLHYHPDGKPETDQSALGLRFTSESPKGLTNIIVGPRRIDLPAGDAHREITDFGVVPQDVELVGITPQAHLLCKEMKVDAKFPDGRSETLIWIKDWDFNWQGQYRYASPIPLPKGTRIEMRYVYDNSEGNPHNPSHPPKAVKFGEQTTDEMGFAFLQVALPDRAAVPAFRKAMLLSRIAEMIRDNNDFSSLGPRQASNLQRAVAAFDRNHNGKLESEEMEALMKFLQGMVR